MVPMVMGIANVSYAHERIKFLDTDSAKYLEVEIELPRGFVQESVSKDSSSAASSFIETFHLLLQKNTRKCFGKSLFGVFSMVKTLLHIWKEGRDDTILVWYHTIP
jgi:hypothetical protein